MLLLFFLKQISPRVCEGIFLRIYVILVRSKSGTLDTLYKILLTEEVHNDQRSDDHKTASVSDSCVVQVLSCIVGLKCGRNVNYIRHKNRLSCCEEHSRIEVISPLP